MLPTYPQPYMKEEQDLFIVISMISKEFSDNIKHDLISYESSINFQSECYLPSEVQHYSVIVYLFNFNLEQSLKQLHNLALLYIVNFL